MGNKLAFIGPHGTGKTTLVHELTFDLKKRGVNVFPLEEVARTSPLPINENSVPKTQLWMITKQISKEIEKENFYETIVCDRSILDSYCYHNYFFGEEKSWEPLIKDYLGTYDEIILVPIREGYLKNDGVRSTSKDFQKGINELFLKNLEKFQINYVNFSESVMREICDKYSHKNL